MKITLLGTGRMGSAMAERLLDQGHALTVWNRTAGKAQKLLARGAHWADAPAQAVAGIAKPEVFFQCCKQRASR